MKAEYLNPFVMAIASIVQQTIDEIPEKGKLFLRKENPFTTENIAIIVGITGFLSGQIVLSFPMSTALRVAAVMLMEEEIEEFDEVAKSALSELANMMAANATIGLSDAGFVCDITPPTVVTGKSIEIFCPESVKTIVIPLRLTFGGIDANLSVVETDDIGEDLLANGFSFEMK